MRLVLCFFILVTTTAFSQNEADLYRYSKVDRFGDARFTAMSGAFGALGANFASAAINPSGFGRYSSSNFGLSLATSVNSNTSNFKDIFTTKNSSDFYLTSLGVVLTEDISSQGKGDLYHQWGFGVNRVADFNDQFRYEGQQFESLLDVFASQATGVYPEDLYSYFGFSTALAWETYAINFDDTDVSYYSLLNSGDMYHTRKFKSDGGMNEWFISYSRNRLNKLYWGANFGIRSVRYLESYTHNEYLLDTSGTSLRSFDYTYDLKTKGTLFNLKVGATYLASESLRFGLAIHSPSFGELEDNWTANMTSTFQDTVRTLPEDLIPIGKYKYRVITPPRIIGSFAYVFGTKGCIDIDIEHIAYNLAHFKSTKDETFVPYNYQAENELARKAFQSAINLNIGGEYVINSTFFIRGGFSYLGNTFKNEQEVEIIPTTAYSGGLGYRNQNFSIDLAYQIKNRKNRYYAFENSFVDNSRTQNIFVVSANFVF